MHENPRPLRRRVLLNALRPLGRILGVRFELSRHRHGGDEPAFGDGMEQDGIRAAVARYEPFEPFVFRRERGGRIGLPFLPVASERYLSVRRHAGYRGSERQHLNRFVISGRKDVLRCEQQ